MSLGATSVPSGLDRASLALSGWYKPDFSGSPWTGSASAGASGGRTISWPTAGEIPVAGTAVNGKAPASFDGTNDVLRDGSLAGSSYLSAAAYSIVMLVKPSAPSGANANAYSDEQLFCISGDQVGISWNSSGVRGWHYNGSNWTPTSHVTCSADSWHMVALTYDGTTQSISVDNGTPQTLARSNVNSLTGIPRLGQSGGAVFTQEDVLELLTAQTAFDATTLTAIYNSFKRDYPSASLP